MSVFAAVANPVLTYQHILQELLLFMGGGCVGGAVVPPCINLRAPCNRLHHDGRGWPTRWRHSQTTRQLLQLCLHTAGFLVSAGPAWLAEPQQGLAHGCSKPCQTAPGLTDLWKLPCIGPIRSCSTGSSHQVQLVKALCPPRCLFKHRHSVSHWTHCDEQFGNMCHSCMLCPLGITVSATAACCR